MCVLTYTTVPVCQHFKSFLLQASVLAVSATWNVLDVSLMAFLICGIWALVSLHPRNLLWPYLLSRSSWFSVILFHVFFSSVYILALGYFYVFIWLLCVFPLKHQLLKSRETLEINSLLAIWCSGNTFSVNYSELNLI